MSKLPIAVVVDSLQDISPPLLFPFDAYAREALGADWKHEIVMYAAPVNVVDLCRAMFNAGRVSASKEQAMERNVEDFARRMCGGTGPKEPSR